MAVVTINVAGIQELADKMASIGANLPTMLMPANETIVQATEEAIADLYPNMASRWRVTINDAPGAGVASVRASGHQAIIKWYEFGTPEHTITAREGEMLAFPGTHEFEGQSIFTPSVEHPGARAHNERTILMADMAEVAYSEWSAALDELSNYF
jgi:hypothetical protein